MVETLVDLAQAAPGKDGDSRQQGNQHGTLQAQAFGTDGFIDWHPLVEGLLNGRCARPGQFGTEQHGLEKIQLEGAGNQQGNQCPDKEQRLARNTAISGKGLGIGNTGDICRAEHDGHDHADADTKRQRQQDAGDGELGPQRDAGIGQGQDVGGWRKEQEGDGRAEAGAFLVDAGEQRLDGAGANGQQAAGPRRGGIGFPFGRIRPQIADDGLLWNQGRQGTGDEKSGHQAEQHMGCQIGGQAIKASLKRNHHPVHV